MGNLWSAPNSTQLHHSSWNCVSICWLCFCCCCCFCCWWQVHFGRVAWMDGGTSAGGVCPETSQSAGQVMKVLLLIWRPLLHGQSCIIFISTWWYPEQSGVKRKKKKKWTGLTRAAWQKEWKFSRVAIITGLCKLHVRQQPRLLEKHTLMKMMTMILQVNCLQISVQLKAITSPVQRYCSLSAAAMEKYSFSRR